MHPNLRTVVLRTLLFRTFFLGAPLLAACVQPGETEIARGNVLASRQKLDEAAAAYRAAAAKAPGRSRPQELLGHVLYDQKKLPEARAAYEAALRVSPEALEAGIGLARLDAETGKLPEAMARMDSLLTRAPDNLYGRLSRAMLALKRGEPKDLAQALEDTAFAMRIDEKNPAVLYTRGSAFLATGEVAQADEAFRLLVERQPHSALGFYGQARVAAIQKDKDRALASLKQARLRSHGENAWQSGEILKDTAFAELRSDPAFVSQVEVL